MMNNKKYIDLLDSYYIPLLNDVFTQSIYNYNLSGLKICVDDLRSGTKEGCHAAFIYELNYILLDIKLFYYQWFQSSYTKIKIDSNPIMFALLHEVNHYLIHTKQITIDENFDEELYCDYMAMFDLQYFKGKK